MSEFEFVFPLFALLVGLSMAEMLTGLAQVLKCKHDVRIGWLTPLLATLILVNLAIFWQGSWEIRGQITATSASLLLVLLVGGAYYLAASLTFPSWGSEVRDLDEHFMEHRRVALLVIASCNLAYFVRIAMLTHDRFYPGWWLANAVFLVLLAMAAFVPDRRLIAVLLWTLLASHLAMLFIA